MFCGILGNGRARVCPARCAAGGLPLGWTGSGVGCDWYSPPAPPPRPAAESSPCPLAPSLGTHHPPPHPSPPACPVSQLTSESRMPISALPAQIYGDLSAGEFQLIRQTLLIFFQDLHIRVSEWVTQERPVLPSSRDRAQVVRTNQDWDSAPLAQPRYLFP